MQLKRSLGFIYTTSYLIGAVIGAGIFLSPKGILKYSGSVLMSLLIWIFCGIMTIVEGLCYAELALMVPKSGGAYTYIREIYGDFLAFVGFVAFSLFISPISMAMKMLSTSTYILTAVLKCDELNDGAVVLLAMCILWLMCFINCRRIKWTAGVAVASTVGKLAALVLIVSCGIYMLTIGHVHELSTGFQNSNTDIANYAFAIYFGLYAYGGIGAINLFVEEVKRPKRTVPLSVITSLFVIISIYVMTNIAYFTVLTKEEVLSSDAVATLFAKRLHPVLTVVITLGVVISILGNCNGHIFGSSRMFFVASRYGHISKMFTLISLKNQTPIAATMLLGMLSSIFMLIGKSFYVLLVYYANLIRLYELLGVSTILVMRYRLSKNPKAPYEQGMNLPLWVPIVFIVFILASAIMSAIGNPVTMLFTIGAVLISVPLYFLFIRRKMPQSVQKHHDQFSLFLQKLLLAEPETEQHIVSNDKTAAVDD